MSFFPFCNPSPSVVAALSFFLVLLPSILSLSLLDFSNTPFVLRLSDVLSVCSLRASPRSFAAQPKQKKKETWAAAAHQHVHFWPAPSKFVCRRIASPASQAPRYRLRSSKQNPRPRPSRLSNRRHELAHDARGRIGPRLHRRLATPVLWRPGPGNPSLQVQRRLLS